MARIARRHRVRCRLRCQIMGERRPIEGSIVSLSSELDKVGAPSTGIVMMLLLLRALAPFLPSTARIRQISPIRRPAHLRLSTN